jgi:hypothetical protein
LTGAWRLPQEGKLALLFVNVSDQLVTATLEFDGKSYGFQGKRLRLTEVSEKGEVQRNCFRSVSAKQSFSAPEPPSPLKSLLRRGEG